MKNDGVKLKIKAAMLSLLMEKDYADITVLELANKAGVSRSSFYRNYASFDELIQSIADDICDKLAEKLVPCLSDHDSVKRQHILVQLFDNLSKTDKRLFQINAANTTLIFSKIQNDFFVNLNYRCYLSIEQRYLFSAMIGIIIAVAHRWIASGCKESPCEIAKLTDSMLHKLQ